MINNLKYPGTQEYAAWDLTIETSAYCQTCVNGWFTFAWKMALLLVEIMQPPSGTQLGSLCLMCSPSEGVGSLMVLLADADLTLDVLLVVVINLAALGLHASLLSVIISYELHYSARLNNTSQLGSKCQPYA